MSRPLEHIEAIQAIVANPILRAQLWLVKNHVPFDVAHALDVIELEAWSIILSEFEGREYDFGTDSWKEVDHG